MAKHDRDDLQRSSQDEGKGGGHPSPSARLSKLHRTRTSRQRVASRHCFHTESQLEYIEMPLVMSP